MLLSRARRAVCVPKGGQLLMRSGCCRGLSAAAPSHGSEFTLERHDSGVRIFSLSRPRANALGRNLLGQLSEAISKVAGDKDARCVVLRSTVTGVFCAGADLKERKEMAPSEVDAFVTFLRATFSSLAELPVPTIAVLDGVALGGGLELALCCDLRIAGSGERVTLGLPETGLGIIPGAGGTQRLPRVVGVAAAKRLIFTGERIDGQAAAAIGLVDEVIGGDSTGAAGEGVDTPAFQRAMQLATTICGRAPIALKMAKQAIDRGSEVDLSTGLAFERACYAQTIPTSDRLEGLAAFAEKRPPVYKGE